MHKIERELIKKTKVDEQEKGEDRQDYLQRLCEAVNLLKEEEWDSMSDAAKEWANTSTRAIKGEKPLPDFDDDAPAAKKPAPKAAAKKPASKAKAAEEGDDEGDDEGTEEEVEETAPKKQAKAAATKDKPHGLSAVAFVRQYVATHPASDVSEIAGAVEKAGYNSLSRSSIGTIRSDFRSIARIIKEQGFLKKGIDLGV